MSILEHPGTQGPVDQEEPSAYDYVALLKRNGFLYWNLDDPFGGTRRFEDGTSLSLGRVGDYGFLNVEADGKDAGYITVVVDTDNNMIRLRSKAKVKRMEANKTLLRLSKHGPFSICLQNHVYAEMSIEDYIGGARHGDLLTKEDLDEIIKTDTVWELWVHAEEGGGTQAYAPTLPRLMEIADQWMDEQETHDGSD